MENNIILSDSELSNRRLSDTTLKIAKHLFEVHGFLKIENLFPKALIESLLSSYLNQLDYNEQEMSIKNGTQVSDKRYIVPIALKAPFNNPELYANPILLPLLKELLGPNMIMSSIGSVTSLPGSTDQHVHADYFSLFEESPHIAGSLPTFGITFAVPLVDIDLINGPTKVYSGSHRTYPIDQKMLSYNQHLVCGPMGSCYFWDYRTFHAGGSNHSDALRPLLYIVYTRRWFIDLLNPDVLVMDEEDYQMIPKEHRGMFPRRAKVPQRKETVTL